MIFLCMYNLTIYNKTDAVLYAYLVLLLGKKWTHFKYEGRMEVYLRLYTGYPLNTFTSTILYFRYFAPIRANKIVLLMKSCMCLHNLI